MSTPPDQPEQPADLAQARAVVAFWTAAGPGKWFSKDPAFDASFRAQFHALHEQAARGELSAWRHQAESALGLVLLLDQFPRNCFRASARMFATDALAREEAERALAAGFDQQLPPALKLFFYLPFEHSESLEDQERSVALQQDLKEVLPYALEHREIIRRFGRFPHRNALLGRETTPEEQAYLDAGGFAG